MTGGALMKKTILPRIVLTVLLLYPVCIFAHPINNLFVFGDSLSDTGNAAVYSGMVLPLPYFANRISNGPLAVGVLAAQLDASTDPYLLGGTNFAVAGALAGGTELGDLSFQLDAFIVSGYDPSNALNLVFIGGNDVRKAARVSDSEAANVLNDALIAVDSTIRSLIGAGAQQILVPNVFDIGLIPESVLAENMYPGYQIRATALTEQYNTALAARLAMIESSTGVDLLEFDLFGFGRDFITNADRYGITNITDSCLFEDPMPLIPKPECDFETYAFFDTIHPTAKYHGLLGAALVAKVPESSSYVLMAIGLFGLGFARRKGKQA
jgi:phospholipase/lecithinase/hemolysin